MKTDKPSRRHLLTRLSAILGGMMMFRNSHAAPSKIPQATEGPYYPKPSMRRADIDNDLVKIEGVVTEAGGEIVTLKGVVTDRSGQALSGIRVEIWQCDVNGKYLHPRDRQNLSHDPAFQGFGHDITTTSGAYSFRTIKPTKYPSRTEHIHVKLYRDKKEVLTTQFYLGGALSNARDWVYSRLSEDEAKAVTMQFKPTDDYPEAIVNIVI